MRLLMLEHRTQPELDDYASQSMQKGCEMLSNRTPIHRVNEVMKAVLM